MYGKTGSYPLALGCGRQMSREKAEQCREKMLEREMAAQLVHVKTEPCERLHGKYSRRDLAVLHDGRLIMYGKTGSYPPALGRGRRMNGEN